MFAAAVEAVAAVDSVESLRGAITTSPRCHRECHDGRCGEAAGDSGSCDTDDDDDNDDDDRPADATCRGDTTV